ncbi:MAG TPA: M13 family metallopeptidase [Candidatus Sulfotelmatobacter sp.]|nr:M13 family metallopeptidase [Candidatus Sulfotelmatobacter sp.]
MIALRTTALILLFAHTFVLGPALGDQNTSTRDPTEDIDRSIKAGDDFYHYANGSWLRTAVIPAGQATYDTRSILIARTTQRVRDLIQEAATAQPAKGGIAQKVGDYYASFMDESKIEAKGMTPLTDEMSVISAIHSKKSLSAYLGTTLNTEVDGLTGNADHVFGVSVNQSFTDSKHYVFHLLQGGLGMPDRDAYLDQSPTMAALRDHYRAHIAAMLKLAGIDDVETRASRILTLEIQIARTHAPDADAADVFKQNNPWKRAGFGTKASGMDWDAYFQAAGVAEQPEFIVWQPSAVTGTSALVGSESVDLWKDYLRFHLIEHYAGVLPKAVADERFAFYGTVLSGTQQAPDRSQEAIAATNAALGQAVGQLYTQRYFPPEAKARAKAMVSQLIAAYRVRIANLTWMSPQTKQKAMAKLDALRIGVGYPDRWIDYSTLEVARSDAFGNMRRAEAFNRSRNLAKLKQPADPDEWRIDPQIVGAVILFSPNTETFSAGILQPPFFDPQGDAASNYGSAGAGIAHEISHSFDELGNIYDDEGRLGNWWTAEDLARYHAAAEKMVAQFNAYCPLSDVCVDGKQVLTENIADMAGLLTAHDAYVLSLKGKADVVINGLTGEQRFFLAFAQRWRKAQNEAALRRQIKTDTHSPGEYRSDTVRNVEAWYQAYDVMPGDKLYLKSEDRVGIW